jgi:hypothetical protein
MGPDRNRARRRLGGRSLIAAYRNDGWGEMRTRWAFTVASAAEKRVLSFPADSAAR